MGNQKGKLDVVEQLEIDLIDEVEDQELHRHVIPIILSQRHMMMLEIFTHFNPTTYPC